MSSLADRIQPTFHENAPRRVFVTGAAGFMGAHLVRTLLSDSYFSQCEVVAFDDLSGGFRDNLPDHPRLRFIEGSVVNHELIDRLFAENQFDLVYHLAAYAAEGLSHFIRRFNYTNNVIGSMNLINAAARSGTRGFLFTSSIAVYGALPPPMRETQTPHPEDPYGIAKFAVEMDLHAASQMFGLPYTIVRPHNVYGEFQNTGDPYRNVIGIFIRALLEDQPLPIFGDGLQTRSFTYAPDISKALAFGPLLEKAKNQIFNLGTDDVTTVLDMARLLAELMGKPLHVMHLPERLEVRAAYADHNASKKVFTDLLGNTPLREGLANMLRSVQQTGLRRSRAFQGIEVDKNLPPSWRKLIS